MASMKFSHVDSMLSAVSFVSGLVFNIILIAYGETWNQGVRSLNPDDVAGKQLGQSLYLRFSSPGWIYCVYPMPVAFNSPADRECSCSLPFSLV